MERADADPVEKYYQKINKNTNMMRVEEL